MTLKKDHFSKEENWEWCWLVLKDKTLYCFRDHHDEIPFVTVNLNDLILQDNSTSNRENIFALYDYKITERNPIHCFLTIDNDEHNRWINYLQRVTKYLPPVRPTTKKSSMSVSVPNMNQRVLLTRESAKNLTVRKHPESLSRTRTLPSSTFPKPRTDDSEFRNNSNWKVPKKPNNRATNSPVQNLGTIPRESNENKKFVNSESLSPRGTNWSSRPREKNVAKRNFTIGNPNSPTENIFNSTPKTIRRRTSETPKARLSPLKNSTKAMDMFQHNSPLSNYGDAHPLSETTRSMLAELDSNLSYIEDNRNDIPNYSELNHIATFCFSENAGVSEDVAKVLQNQKLDLSARSRSVSLINGIIDEIEPNSRPDIQESSNTWRPIDRSLPPSQQQLPIGLSGRHRQQSPGDMEDLMEVEEIAKINKLKKIFIAQGDPKKKYVITNQTIGKGSVGEVFFATCGDKKVAIKRLELIRRGRDRLPLILREIEIIATSQHPNIVQYIETYDMGEEMWVVMEYMSAGSLYDIVKLFTSGVRLTEEQTAYAVHEVLEAVAFLHGRKRIHRDIKVDNILLAKDGSVKLADFGTAVQLTFQRLRRNTLAGTPYYMAPELIQRLPYKETVDIWSIGITVVELMTGRPPYYHLDPQQALEAIVRNGVRGLAGSSFSENIINFTNVCCLAHDPDNRSSATALLRHVFIQTRCTKDNFRNLLSSIHATHGKQFDEVSQPGCTIL